MARNWTTLPVRGDDEYRDKLRAEAEGREMYLGDLVRAALDQFLRNSPQDTSFFASDGTHVYQMEHVRDDQ